MLANATPLELTLTVLLVISAPLTFVTSLRAYRRIGAVSASDDRRAAIDWFRKVTLLGGFVALTLWGVSLSLFTAPGTLPPEWVQRQMPWYRYAGIALVSSLLIDALWTTWSDHRFAQELEPLVRMDDGT